MELGYGIRKRCVKEMKRDVRKIGERDAKQKQKQIREQKQKQKQRQRKNQKREWNSFNQESFFAGIFCAIFLLILYLVPAGYLICQDRDFSQLENRALQTAPDIKKKAFLAGKLPQRMETYLADQFPERDRALFVKSLGELLLGKTENNGVYRGSGGQLFQKFETPDGKLLKRNMSYIRRLADKCNLYLMLVPTQAGTYPEKLPRYAEPYKERDFLSKAEKLAKEKIFWISALPVMEEHKEEYIYYRTDHHWTTLGAYYGYQAFCEAAGLTGKKREEYKEEVVSTAFYGSLYSMGNFQWASPDEITLFREKAPESVTVTYVAENEIKKSLYEEDWLKKKDQYNVFLDGNHPLTVIREGSGKGARDKEMRGKKKSAKRDAIAVVKDSYANCFLPFLTAEYKEVHVLDLRFLNIPVETYLESSRISDVLILYNVQSFAKETSFSQLNAE